MFGHFNAYTNIRDLLIGYTSNIFCMSKYNDLGAQPAFQAPTYISNLMVTISHQN